MGRIDTSPTTEAGNQRTQAPIPTNSQNMPYLCLNQLGKSTMNKNVINGLNTLIAQRAHIETYSPLFKRFSKIRILFSKTEKKDKFYLNRTLSLPHTFVLVITNDLKLVMNKNII